MALSDLLAAVQADAASRMESAMTDTCTVQRRARASDGEGGWTLGNPTTVATVACMVSLIGNAATEGVIGEAVRADARYLIRLPLGTDVTSDDRIVCGSDTFEVTEPQPRTYEPALRVLARQVG